MAVDTGDVVLFRISETPEKWRPLLVVTVVDGDTISGEVFLDYERDRNTEWARTLFYSLQKDARTQWVSGIGPGMAVGQWKSRALQEWVKPEVKSRGPIKGVPFTRGTAR